MERWRDETESGKTLKFRLISCFSIRKRVSCRLEVKAQTYLQRCQVRLILLTCSALSLYSMFPVVLPGTVPNFIPPAGSIYMWVCAQHHQALTVWVLFFPPPMSCPSIHPLIQSFIHLSNHSSGRKPVPAAPPNGSAIICSQSFQSLLFRHMHVSPKWCQDWLESSVVQHMLSAQSSFPQMTFSSPLSWIKTVPRQKRVDL